MSEARRSEQKGKEGQREIWLGKMEFLAALSSQRGWAWTNGPTSGPPVERSERRKVATLGRDFSEKVQVKRAEPRGHKGRRIGWEVGKHASCPSFSPLCPFFSPHEQTVTCKTRASM